MDFLKKLPNLEEVFDGSAQDLLAATKPGSIGTTVAASGDWFNWDSPDYSHFDSYDAAVDAVAAEINAALGATAKREQGFDDETFETIPRLEQHDLFADFFYYWPKENLFLISAHEDKELPIEIALVRTA